MNEKTILEPARSIPVSEETDVLVVGGGTAGAVAAISAARCGVRVTLVEQMGSLGGAASNGLVTPMMSTHLPKPIIQSALSEEINRRLDKAGHGFTLHSDSHWFDPEYIKLVLEEMAVEAGVSLRYYTIVSSVLVEEGAVRGIIIEDKAGRSAILAGCVVDCTGDGDVCVKAGVPYESGDEVTGRNQAISVRYMMGGVDIEAFREYLRKLGGKLVDSPPTLSTALIWDCGWPVEPLFRQAVEEGELTYEDGIYWQTMTVPGCPGYLAFNCPEIFDKTDGADPAHLTHAQIAARQATYRQAAFYRKHFPGFGSAYVSSTAPLVGVRESRRIHGRYTLTAKDAQFCRKFEDWVARCNYPMDVHGKDMEEDLPVSAEDGLLYYEIPFGCLVAQGLEGLMMAGRCISAEFLAESSLRIQPIARTLGEAAGIGAAISVREGIPAGGISGRRVREEMDKRIAALGPAE